MTFWAAAISGLLVLIAARDWRNGLLAVLVVGVLQDVFRKLTPGAPAYFILWSVAVYAMVFLIAFSCRRLPPISVLYLRNAGVRFWLLAFLLILGLQLLHSLVRYGNPAIPVLGALFYLGPIAAMLIGAAFANSERNLRRFMMAYLVIFVPVTLTIYLSLEYADAYPVLRDVGEFTGQALRIFDVGTVLKSNPGLLRVGEIAAWHAATCIVFLSILSLISRSIALRIFNILLVVVLVGAIVLTGRRKMLVALTVFFALQWGMLIVYRWGFRRIGVVLLALAVVLTLGLMTYQPSTTTSDYLARSQTAYTSIDDRLAVTLALAKSALYQSNGIGLGAGSTSQGARYAGVGVSEAGWAAEAGLGKIVVELGIPGFFALLMLFLCGGFAVRHQLRFVAHLGRNYLVYDVSFIAFLFANLAAFIVASQLFGDFFVLIVIGTIAGFGVRIHYAAMQHAAAGSRHHKQSHRIRTVVPGQSR